ncbi:hypothetical protein C9374_007845 [Naegleria lovaniensis]|uniref:Uncharacterized protein n=1 Tax=Naegleria lovaniensis TaxID=51637 RepID=A0AA88GFV5_NAELO|nr:uncharacterized protein C9374_007845 [Naegleria lovaniensis]KAG2378697.1 hypothetical protein C9374_007845 [Naegleria lovaniensis]
MVFILRKINHYDNCGHIYVHELAKSQQKDSTNSTITNNKKQRRRRSSKTPQHDTSSSAAAQQHTSQTTPFHALSVVSSLHPELNSTGINDLRKLHTRSLTSNTTATTSTRGDSSTTTDFNRHDMGSISSSRASSMAISDLDSHSVLSFNYYGIENRRVTFKDAMRPSSSSSASSSNNSVASAASDSVATNHRKRGKHPVYEIDNTSFHEEELMAANPYSSDLRHLSLDTNSSKNSKGFLTNLFKTKSRSKFELEIIRQQKNRDKHFQSMIGLLAQLRAVCKVVLEISNDLLGDVNRIGNRIVSLNHRVEASKRKTLFHVTHILTTAEKDATSSFDSKQHDIKFRYNNHVIMSMAATRKNSGIETDACTVHQRAVDLLHEVKSRKVSNATTTQDNQASAEKSMTENLNIRESSFSLSVLKPSNSISRSTTEPIREWLSPTQSTTNMVGPMKPPLSFEKLLTLPEPLQHRYEKRCHKDPVFHPKADAQLIKITTSSTTFKDLQNRKSTPFCSYLHDIDVLKWIHEGHVTKCSQLVSFPDFFRLKWQEQLEQKSRHQQHLTTPRGRPTSCSISSLSSAVDDSYPHHHHHYSEGMDEEYHVDILDARSSRAKPILLEKKPMRIPRWATMESVFTKYGRDTVGAEFDDDDLASCTSNTASLTRSSTSSSNYFYPHQKQHPYYVGSSSTTSTTTSNDSTYNTSTSSNLDSCEDWNYGREARHHGHHTKDKKTNKRFSLRLFGHSKNQKNHPFHEKKSKAMVELIQNQVYGHIARSLEWQHKNHSISSSHNEDYDDDESSYSSTSIMHINDVYNSRKESRRRFLNALRNYQNSKDLLNKLNTRRYSYDSASSSSSDSSDDEDISSDTCSVVRIPIAGTPQSRQPRPSSIETTVSALSMDFSSFASHPQASHLMNTMENHHDTKSNRNFLSPPPSLPQNHNIILNNQYAGHSPYTPSSNPSQSLDSLESSASETETDTSNMGELPPIFETLHEAALKKNRTLHAENHRTLDAVPNIKRMEEVNTMTTEIMDASNPSLNVESERSIVSSKKEPHLVVGEHTRRIVENLNRHDQHSSASTEPSSSFSSTTSSSLHSSDIGNNNNNSSSSSFSPNVVVVKQILSQEPIRMEPHPSRRGVVCNADEEDLQILNSLRKQCLPSNTFSQQQDHEQTTEEDDNNHDNMSNTTGSVAYSFGQLPVSPNKFSVKRNYLREFNDQSHSFKFISRIVN